MGKSTMRRNHCLPGNSYRSSATAAGNPNVTLKLTAPNATYTLFQMERRICRSSNIAAYQCHVNPLNGSPVNSLSLNENTTMTTMGK
jgi:hypothetical protein